MGMAAVYKEPSALDVVNANRLGKSITEELDAWFEHMKWPADPVVRAEQLTISTSIFLGDRQERLNNAMLGRAFGDTWLVDGMYFEHGKMFLKARKPKGGKSIVWECRHPLASKHRSARLRKRTYQERMHHSAIQELMIYTPAKVKIFILITVMPGQPTTVKYSVHA